MAGVKIEGGSYKASIPGLHVRQSLLIENIWVGTESVGEHGLNVMTYSNANGLTLVSRASTICTALVAAASSENDV